MGKCFLGLWSGVLFGLAYLVSYAAGHENHWANAVPGMLEWVTAGGLLTVVALIGYMLYAAYQTRRVS